MASQFHIEIVDKPAEDLREAVNVQLRTHNQTSNPIFWEARDKPENHPQPIDLFAFADDGSVIGGLFGHTAFSWLRIDIMATAKEWRGCGVGTALLARAEELAKNRGCKYAYVDTMETQAPGFYHKAGYKTAGEIEDWDSHGNKKYFLTKALA